MPYVILSLSKLKRAYNVITKPAQRSVRLMVDHTLSHAVQCQMEKTYDNLSSGNHNVLCSCGEEYTESHSFREGVCLCGALEAVEPAEDDLISIGEQLYLESDLAMHFRIREEKLTDYQITTAYLVVERDVYASDGTMTVDVQTITNHTIANGRLIFVYSGISAAQMNDEIRAPCSLRIRKAWSTEARRRSPLSPIMQRRSWSPCPAAMTSSIPW